MPFVTSLGQVLPRRSSRRRYPGAGTAASRVAVRPLRQAIPPSPPTTTAPTTAWRGFDVGETFAGVDYDTGVAAAQEFAQLAPDNPAGLALRWIIDQPGVTSVIPGARNVEQARANAAAAGLPPVSTAPTRRSAASTTSTSGRWCTTAGDQPSTRRSTDSAGAKPAGWLGSRQVRRRPRAAATARPRCRARGRGRRGRPHVSVTGVRRCSAQSRTRRSRTSVVGGRPAPRSARCPRRPSTG